MRILTHKLILFLTLNIVFSINAQREKHKEEFSVKPDVVIDINTRHSDIEIETWNKNKVVVEAFLIIEGEEITDEVYNDFYKKWDFEVTGNSKKITIKSRANSTIDIHAFDFDDINYEEIEFPLANFSIGSLDVLDSLDFIEPPMPPELPVLPEMPEVFIDYLPSEFNFDEYKKDKSYLERWKKENEDFIGKNAKVKTVGDFIVINSDDTNISINTLKDKEAYIKSIREKVERKREEARRKIERKREEARRKVERKREEARAKIEQAHEERRKKIEKIREQKITQREKLIEARQEALIERLKHNAIRRTEIKQVLQQRNKLKVKRIIKIKAPKNAKLNMNVKYGELSFTK